MLLPWLRLGPGLLLTLLLAVLLWTMACVSVHVEEDGTRTVRTFGASTTTVDADGEIITKSEGLSEGFVGGFVELGGRLSDAALALMGRSPQPPPQVVFVPPALDQQEPPQEE